jgi:5-hydroxyisourate hydrolase-like protein (transthyretin family)
VFNLKNGASELYSAVGNTSFDPLDGVTVTTSQSQTATSGITYTVKDAAGTETTVANAAATAGTYTVTYSYKDSFKGTVTKAVNWTVTASSAQINLAADTISTTVGDAAIDPLAGVSVTTSSGETITDVSTSVTYTITDAGGNTVDAASAAAAAGTYTITYSYTDTIYGAITKTASWTVASVEQTVPSESETSAEAVPEST